MRVRFFLAQLNQTGRHAGQHGAGAAPRHGPAAGGRGKRRRTAAAGDDTYLRLGRHQLLENILFLLY